MTEKKIKLLDVPVSRIKPYWNNPRDNSEAVKYLVKSIKDYGFKNPLILDKEFVVICGHTRLEAAQQLGIKKLPCIIADDLTDEQAKAYRLADNKVQEFSSWDFEKLQDELGGINEIDMSAFQFFKFDDDDDADFSDVELEKSEPEGPVSKQVICKCPKCGRQFEIK